MKKRLIILVSLILLMVGCEVLNMINCKYKLDGVSNPTWAGIHFADIKSLNDISATDLLKAATAIAGNDYNLKFDFNVLAANETESPAKILGFDYKFLIDDTEFTRGTSSQQYNVSSGATANIPITMNLDIKEFITGNNIENLINLTSNLVNYGNGEPSNIKMQIAPLIPVGEETVQTPYITLNKTFQ